MNKDNFASLNRRTIIFIAIVASAVVITFRLFQMQILHRENYEIKSSDNSIKDIEIKPLRGIFYDRNLNIIVSNKPAYTLRITPAYYDKNLNNILETVIDEKPGYIDKLLKKYKGYSKYLPIKVKRGIEFDAIAWLEENSSHLPGVDYIVEMHRDYPSGIIGSHIFGYTKEISAKQLEKEKKFYNQGDYVGFTGVEKTYEKNLRGSKGTKFVIVNSKRKEIGRYKNGLQDIVPVKGNDLVLTIDYKTQKAAEDAFKDKLGALVAIEPSTGEILAFVSAPEFDLNKFSYITPKEFLDQLYNDPDKPLFNRATMSINPPGSTFKMLAAIAALDMGIITPSYSTFCAGGFTYGRFFKCHGSHGTVNVVKAIEKSCNTFFYKLIYKIGLDNWAAYADKFGFGNKTGIDIGEEKPGFVPDESYYIKRYGPNWPKSIMASLSIGQGEISVTPLQLAKYTSLIANNGKSVTPHLVKGYVDKNSGTIIPFGFKKISVDVKQNVFDIVKEGMFKVVNGKGTATHIRLPDIEIAGKTGTAQNPHGEDHALFVAFAPFDNPKIAVAVLVENVGFGGTHAAPIAKKIIETYLHNLQKPETKIEKKITKLETSEQDRVSAN